MMTKARNRCKQKQNSMYNLSYVSLLVKEKKNTFFKNGTHEFSASINNTHGPKHIIYLMNFLGNKKKKTQSFKK